MWLEDRPRLARGVVLLSGVVLIAMSFFWVMPEIAEHSGRVFGLAFVAGGFSVLWLINHFLYPVCPSCGHSHEHGANPSSLHGFALPLIAFAGLHSFVDGWSVGASHESGFADLQFAFTAGIALHKIPEGLALGGLMRAAVSGPLRALGGAVSAQAMALAGWVFAGLLAPYAGPRAMGAMLGIAGGAFLFLGVHALEGTRRRRGAPEPARDGV